MSTAVLPVPVEAQPVVAPVVRQRWSVTGTVEIALVAGFYQWYSAIRHWVGGSTSTAQRNAMHVVAWERGLGIFNEASVQAAALAHPAVMRAAASYYGTAHFVVPAVALVVLYRRDRERYFTWRNALGWTSALALAAFALFPTMPPRLLPAAFHFTNVTTSGVDRAFVPDLYNGFAAMPSLHAAYATWALCALWPVVRSKWTRALLVAHVVLIVAVVLVTANHYYLDLVGGVAVMATGALLARRHHRRGAASAPLAIALLGGAAACIWLPRVAPLPVTLDAAGVAVVAFLALEVRRTAAFARSP
jgi:hypothetical protein